MYSRMINSIVNHLYSIIKIKINYKNRESAQIS